jgi:hypothetical protein
MKPLLLHLIHYTVIKIETFTWQKRLCSTYVLPVEKRLSCQTLVASAEQQQLLCGELPDGQLVLCQYSVHRELQIQDWHHIATVKLTMQLQCLHTYSALTADQNSCRIQNSHNWQQQKTLITINNQHFYSNIISIYTTWCWISNTALSPNCDLRSSQEFCGNGKLYPKIQQQGFMYPCWIITDHLRILEDTQS